jgi:hypothetical protein
MANKYMKKCLTTLAIREIQIETTVRFHLTPVRMAIIKKTKNNFGKDVVKMNPNSLLFGM